MIHWMQRRLWPPLKRTWQGWSEDDGGLLSAAMAYYAALSLFPLCLILIAVLGVVMRLSAQAQDEQRQLLEVVRQNASPWLATQLSGLLGSVQSRAVLGGPLGFLALLVTTIGLFTQVETTFDRIWGTTNKQSQSWWAFAREALYDRLTAFVMLLAVGGLLVAVFLANMVLAGLRSHIVAMLPAGSAVWRVVQIAFTIGCNALLFGIIYKTIPKAQVPWRSALAGGLFVSIIWEIGQQVLALLVIGEHYSAYGLVGSFIAIMLWFYYASALVFLGAEFVQALDKSD